MSTTNSPTSPSVATPEATTARQRGGLANFGVDTNFGIAMKGEFSNSDEVRKLSLPRRWFQFCCNPFTRRYRCRPAINPAYTLVVVGLFGLLFIILAICLQTIDVDEFSECRIEYPSFTYDMSGNAETAYEWDFPWVEPGVPVCDPVEGCYRDDIVTVAPRMCKNLLSPQDEQLAAEAQHSTDEPYALKGTYGYSEGTILKGNIRLYYAIEPFYQNHRRYALSRNAYQLSGYGWDGRSVTYATDPMNICTPMISLEDAHLQYGLVDKEGTPLPGYPPLPANLSTDWSRVMLYPCGLQAFSVFNDTLAIEEYDPMGSGASVDVPLYRSPDLISADPDITFFQQLDETQEAIPTDELGKEMIYRWMPRIWFDNEAGNGLENAHFMNWMRLGSTHNIMKLYAVLSPDPAGTTRLELPLRVRVRNRYNVDPWGGKKFIVLTTGPEIGRVTKANYEVFWVLGAASLAICIGFSVKLKLNPRKRGDTRFIGGRYHVQG